MSETFQGAAGKIAREMVELLTKKQQDYGPKNILDFGIIGVLIRANDKLARLKNLYGIDDSSFQIKEAQNESILDTWRDLGNYAIIAQMLIEKTFTLPMAKQEKNESGLEP